MYKVKENPHLGPNEVKEYIKTSYQYFMFDSKIEYKKLQHLIKEKPLTSLTGVNRNFLQKKICEIFPKRESARRYSNGISGDNALKVLEELQLAKAQAIEYSLKEGAAVFLLKLTGDKLRDGKNGISINIFADVYLLKTPGAVDRYSRKSVKLLINDLFHQWRSNSAKKFLIRYPKNNLTDVLPSKLLQELTEGDLEWNEFCEALLTARQKEN